MGALFDKRQPPQRAWLKNKELHIVDILGNEYTFDVDMPLEYREDCSRHVQDVFVYLENEHTYFVARKDSTYGVFRKKDNLLMFFGLIKGMNKSDLFDIEYEDCGYYRYKETITSLILEKKNRRVIHLVTSTVSPSSRTWISPNPLPEEFDLLRATRIAADRTSTLIPDGKPIICTPHGIYPYVRLKEWGCCDE